MREEAEKLADWLEVTVPDGEPLPVELPVMEWVKNWRLGVALADCDAVKRWDVDKDIS